MDTQIATNSRGFLHAVSCVQSDQDARRFQSVMEHQGFVVERLSQVVAVARFARAKRPTRAPERPAQAPFPEPGTQVQFKVDQERRTGSVVTVLRWPAGHPHCPGRVALLVRSPGWEGLVEPHAAQPVTVVQHPAPAVERPRPIPIPPKRPAVSQPGLW